MPALPLTAGPGLFPRNVYAIRAIVTYDFWILLCNLRGRLVSSVERKAGRLEIVYAEENVFIILIIISFLKDHYSWCHMDTPR